MIGTPVETQKQEYIKHLENQQDSHSQQQATDMNIIADDDEKVLPNKSNTSKFQNTDTAFMLDSNQNPDL